MSPDSSSENMRKPLFMSSVRGTKVLAVAAWGRRGSGFVGLVNSLAVTTVGRLGAGANSLLVTTCGRHRFTSTSFFSAPLSSWLLE